MASHYAICIHGSIHRDIMSTAGMLKGRPMRILLSCQVSDVWVDRAQILDSFERYFCSILYISPFHQFDSVPSRIQPFSPTTIVPVPPDLTQEIVEAVIDLAKYDLKALGTFALVGKAWLPRLQWDSLAKE
jgi:hypothetical protein